jgi:hypothetical protein
MLEDSQRGLKLPTTKIFHVLEETKEKHTQNNGRETLMNWHPCFISVTHLAASALGPLRCILFFCLLFSV